MQNFCSSTNQSMRPIPLIQLEGERFKISQQAKQFLRSLQGPLGVITIVGKYRTGKSLFLNKVLLNNNQSFKVCPTINSCTKGLWISRQVIKSEHPDAQDMNVIVIDTEGFGAMQQTDAYNNKILLFALLLSSYFIYNSVGSIDEKNLNNLTILTNLAKELQSKNAHNDKIQEQFPTFMWIVRDFTLRLVDTNGCQMEPKEYLEYALEIQKGTSDAVENKNKIRRMIKHFFKQRDCYTLVTPVQNQSDLQKLNQLPDSALRPEFLEQITSLRQKILKRIKPKKLKSKRLTSQTFIEMACSYMEAINNGSLPNIDSAWKTISNFEVSQTVSKTKQIIIRKSTDFTSILKRDEDFQILQKDLLDEALVYMKKNITSDSVLELNYSAMKGFISQTVSKCRVQNKKKSLDVLIEHFESKSGQFGYEMQAIELQSKWRNLQSFYRSHYKENPSLNQFLLEHLYPLRLTIFTQLSKGLQNSLKSCQSSHSIQKQAYEKQISQLKNSYRECENSLQQYRSELQLSKIKQQQDGKLKKLQFSYMTKELQQTKQELYEYHNKNEQLKQQLKQKEDVILQLKMKTNGLTVGLKDRDDQCAYTRKQIQILKLNLASKMKQIEQLKNANFEFRSDVERLQQRQRSMNNYTKSEIQTKATQYALLYSKYDELQGENSDLKQKITKLELTLQHESARILKQERLYQTMLQTLKKNYEDERQHIMQLTEANKNMSFALKHLEQRFQQAQQKQKKLKQFKRCFKNSSCMQCQNCSKFFVPAIFPQHLNICILGLDNIQKMESDKSKAHIPEIQIAVKQTLLKDSDSKPYTEYVLEIKKNGRTWVVNRKYKQFSNLHTQLKTLLPGINLSDCSYIVNPQQGAKKTLHVDERRKILQKYLRDLCLNPHITQENIWKQFIGDVQSDSYTPLVQPQDKMAISELLRSSKNISLQQHSAQKQNYEKINHKTPQQFLKIWNQRNLRAKQMSKAKLVKK